MTSGVRERSAIASLTLFCHRVNPDFFRQTAFVCTLAGEQKQLPKRGSCLKSVFVLKALLCNILKGTVNELFEFFDSAVGQRERKLAFFSAEAVLPFDGKKFISCLDRKTEICA